MGTLLLNHIMKQASFYLNEKYKNARMALTDVTAAELLAEEATNGDPWAPDAKTMTEISEASFFVDDYWRIVYVLHKRFYSLEWKNWRQSYKSLILLEFLLTHGPPDFVQEFQSDIDVIEELGRFMHIDENGFNWGRNMRERSDKVVELLGGGETLRTARLKALNITKEIQGFGTGITSPSSTTCTDSSRTSASSFGSFSSTGSTNNDDMIINEVDEGFDLFPSQQDEVFNRIHLWDYAPILQEKGSLLGCDCQGEKDEKPSGFIIGLFSKLIAILASSKIAAGHKVPFSLRSYSEIGKLQFANNF